MTIDTDLGLDLTALPSNNQGLHADPDELDWIDAIVSHVRDEALGVRSFEFAAASDIPLPDWPPGAHIDIEIDGGRITRQFSLCGAANSGTWTVAVLYESAGRGGSVWMHRNAVPKARLKVRGPRNHFPLREGAHTKLVAGGIGITPIIAMVRDLEAHGRSWELLYGGRRRETMAFLDELMQFGPKVMICPADELGHLNLDAFLGRRDPDTNVYCCGPEQLLDAVQIFAREWPDGALHLERFRPIRGRTFEDDRPFELELSRSGATVTVAAGETMVEAAARIGVHIPTSCGEGICGTCVCDVIDGMPEHRDSFLSDLDRNENRRVAPCCSRARTSKLAIDY
ncbi:PDR/VanB family oxidoreductase [Chelatococcus reniformis]|uniref:Ferredoxin n=1 Tax=Chelatococcus reniformis TaxID=1494448 RepID=A0A916UYQ6_9HYPH|nr:PDR/VanB family oxidoreductase [Chelatococcus reniformis]GGC93902.1 ferredoxin [Chelatococcus reniformis]